MVAESARCGRAALLHCEDTCRSPPATSPPLTGEARVSPPTWPPPPHRRPSLTGERAPERALGRTCHELPSLAAAAPLSRALLGFALLAANDRRLARLMQFLKTLAARGRAARFGEARFGEARFTEPRLTDARRAIAPLHRAHLLYL